MNCGLSWVISRLLPVAYGCPARLSMTPRAAAAGLGGRDLRAPGGSPVETMRTNYPADRRSAAGRRPPIRRASRRERRAGTIAVRRSALRSLR